MKYGQLPGIDKPISRIVQGCMMLDDRADGIDKSFEILDNAFEHDITCFDNGIVYGGGRCERAFGKWLQARGNREQVVILDKGCHHNADRKRVTPHDIATDIADGLARLQTDYIDIWMFHRDDPEQAVEPLVDELNRQLEAGRIKAFGGSNWSAERIQAANDYAKANGLQGFAASSPNFSLARQLDEPWKDCVTISGPENEATRQWHRDTGIPAFTWSSLARGFLSGRITRANAEEMKSQVEEHVFRCYASEDNWDRLDRAADLADRKGLTIAQIALAFVLNQDFDTYALVASYTAEEAEANAATADIELSAEERQWLNLELEALPA